jgi:hypothetical protein
MVRFPVLAPPQVGGTATLCESSGCNNGASCRSSSTGSELVNENLAASSPGTKAETVP